MASAADGTIDERDGSMLGATIRASDPLDEVDLAALPLISLGAHGEIAVGSVLGIGGMGVVHSAMQIALRRDVAVKHARAGDREAAAALVREARILGALEHPNVPPVHLLGRDASGAPVLVMKRIEGRSWGSLLSAKEDVPIERSLEILEAVCRALQFAHERGIVHRDVKPDNVMLGDHGEIQLVDWGIAVSVDETDARGIPTASRSRSLAGTPAYMAPEMARRADGDEHALVTPRTDVYLAGATLYEVLTGKPPHDAPSVPHAVAHARGGIVAQPSDAAPRELAEVCMRALSADPEQRFESAETLRAALASCRKRLAVAGLVRASLERARTLAELSRGASSAERRTSARALYGEATFGFDQALLVAPDDAAARAGRDEATCAMAWIELRSGDERAAAALAEQLVSVPPDLAGAIDAHRAKKDAEQSELAGLRGLARDHDARVGNVGRTAIIVALAVLWGGFTVIAGALSRNAPKDPRFTFAIAVVVPIAFGASVLIGALVLRPVMPATAINRRFLVGLLVAGAWLLASRCWVVDVLGLPLPYAIANDLGGLSVLTTGMALAVDRRLGFVAVAFLACAAAAAAWPQRGPELLTVSLVLFAATTLRIWRYPKNVT